MKKIFFLTPIFFSVLLFARHSDPLMHIASDGELNAFSEPFLHAEKIQRKHLYIYVKYLKGRYLLHKKISWSSSRIFEAIDVQTQFKYLEK